jgi:hypothetical protein
MWGAKRATLDTVSKYVGMYAPSVCANNADDKFIAEHAYTAGDVNSARHGVTSDAFCPVYVSGSPCSHTLRVL